MTSEQIVQEALLTGACVIGVALWYVWAVSRPDRKPKPVVAEIKTDAPLAEVKRATFIGDGDESKYVRPSDWAGPGFDANDGASRGQMLQNFEVLAENVERTGQPLGDEALRRDVNLLTRAVTRGYLTIAEAQRFAERLAGSSARLMTVGFEPDPTPPTGRDARRRAALEQWAEEQERMAEIMFDKEPPGNRERAGLPKWGGDPYAFPTKDELAKMEGVTIYEPPKPVTRAKLALDEDV